MSVSGNPNRGRESTRKWARRPWNAGVVVAAIIAAGANAIPSALSTQNGGAAQAPTDAAAPGDALTAMPAQHGDPARADAALVDDDEAGAVGPPRPGAEVDPDLQFLRSVLQNPANPPDVRQGAAQRIVSRGSTDAMRIINEALRSGDAGQVDAVATAIDEESRRAGSMLDSLMVALASAPRALHPKITRLLSREGDAAAERAALAALDATSSDDSRLGAIYAMSQLRGRDQLSDLILLLDEKRRESPEILREACEALERATGQRLGVNPEGWRQWWAARRATPSPEFHVASLQEQVAQLQQQLDLEVERSGKLKAKLRQAYLDLLLPLPTPERSERIAALFDDELPEVRMMGLAHVERMLRNGERPSDALIARVGERLTDRVPSMRVGAVRLLDTVAAPGLSERVAQLLPAESDAATAEAMLRLLAMRPSAAGFGPAAARINDPVLAEAAAMAVNRIVDAGLAPAGWEAMVVEGARRGVTQKPTCELARLLGAAGSEADRDFVMRLLSDSAADESLRTGAAEGMRRAGRRRALVERAAADSVIYPVAVASIADQPASPAVVAALLELPPKPEQAEAWNAAMTRVLSGLPARDLLAADERLAPLAFVAPMTRRAGLRAAIAAPLNGSDPGLRSDLIARLADLLIEQGASREVLTLLADERGRETPALKARYFRAAVFENEYEMAARIEPAAAAWISLLQSLVPQSPRAARPLVDEINHRFGSALSPTEKEQLAALERSLAAAATGEG